MKKVAILGHARTPFGAQGGALREALPEKLATAALTGAVERGKVPQAALKRIGLGTLLDAGRGPNPARALILEAGFEEAPSTLPTGFSVRAGGGSGLEALALLAAEIEGDEVAAAIGADSASLAPYLLPEARVGSRLGHGRMLDSAQRDAWVASDEELPLPALAAILMQPLELDRARFLDVRKRSLERARAAAGKGEIVAVSVPGPKGDEPHEKDDLPGAQEPSRGDEVYAAPLADGAAAVVIATLEQAAALKREDAPTLVAIARVAVESRKAPVAPAAALASLLARNGRKPRDLRAVEVDESLFVGAEAARRELDLLDDQLNPRGGAHAYGHAAGACGLRALVALLAQLESRGGGLGAVAYGTGGGEALALLVER
jgi:acetyl-CoA C-acetyltransferase